MYMSDGIRDKDRIIILGDFNIPTSSRGAFLKFCQHTACGAHTPNHKKDNTPYEFMNSDNLHSIS